MHDLLSSTSSGTALGATRGPVRPPALRPANSAAGTALGAARGPARPPALRPATGAARCSSARPSAGGPFAALAVLAAVTAGVSGCSLPSALGGVDEANSLIIIVADSMWAEVEADTRAVLEPTIFTTRDEKQYELSSIDPSHSRVIDLIRFRNVLVFGTEDDTLLMKAADAAGLELPDLEPGRVFQASDVWARGQTVTATLVRRGREAETWIAALPSVLNQVDIAYRRHALLTMFATPPDTALAADLQRRFGFSLTVPELYDRFARDLGGGDSLVILRNDNPDPNELIRSLLVAWRPSVDSLSAELALDWRAEIDGTHYNVPQRINDANSGVLSFDWHGSPALEVTGVWEDESGGFPAAGPFIVWVVDCPARTFFVDAWLYSPNRPKYQYMLQLQEILGSFRCTPPAQ